MTTPTPPRDLNDHDRAGIAGTLHTPDPAAVARLRALMAQQQPRPAQAEAIRRQYSGDRIVANLRRAAEAVNARRRFVLNSEELADVEARRADGESWMSIAHVYHVTDTTLMLAYDRQMRARRRAAKEEQTQ